MAGLFVITGVVFVTYFAAIALMDLTESAEILGLPLACAVSFLAAWLFLTLHPIPRKPEEKLKWYQVESPIYRDGIKGKTSQSVGFYVVLAALGIAFFSFLGWMFTWDWA